MNHQAPYPTWCSEQIQRLLDGADGVFNSGAVALRDRIEQEEALLVRGESLAEQAGIPEAMRVRLFELTRNLRLGLVAAARRGGASPATEWGALVDACSGDSDPEPLSPWHAPHLSVFAGELKDVTLDRQRTRASESATASLTTCRMLASAVAQQKTALRPERFRRLRHEVAGLWRRQFERVLASVGCQCRPEVCQSIVSMMEQYRAFGLPPGIRADETTLLQEVRRVAEHCPAPQACDLLSSARAVVSENLDPLGRWLEVNQALNWIETGASFFTQTS